MLCTLYSYNNLESWISIGFWHDSWRNREIERGKASGWCFRFFPRSVKPAVNGRKLTVLTNGKVFVCKKMRCSSSGDPSVRPNKEERCRRWINNTLTISQRLMKLSFFCWCVLMPIEENKHISFIFNMPDQQEQVKVVLFSQRERPESGPAS